MLLKGMIYINCFNGSIRSVAAHGDTHPLGVSAMMSSALIVKLSSQPDGYITVSCVASGSEAVAPDG